MDAERKVAPSLFYLAEEKERDCGGGCAKREEKINKRAGVGCEKHARPKYITLERRHYF
jgi:hypothetical protein